jgi:uncharacterized protein involved in type VI secretion and phage assembly
VDTLANGGRAGGGAGGGALVGSLRQAALVVGEVTNINDPDRRGRVRVRFPGLSRGEESAWARVVTMGGGAKRGAVFLPEVNDEVLIGFESGDIRQPVVLGGLYGQKSDIPRWDVAQGKVSTRRITSRVGHVVELSDGDGAATQHVLVQLAGEKHKFRLGKDRCDIEIPEGTPLAIKAGNTSIAFTNQGAVSIEGLDITLKAKNKVTIQGTQIDVKANAKLALEGTGQTQVKGATTNIDGTGMLALKGGMVQIN